MDVRTLSSACVSGEGWGLLQSLPPYDEASRHGAAGRLRDGRASTPTSSPPR